MAGRLPDLPNNLGRHTFFEAARRINGTFNSATIDLANHQGRALVRMSSSLGIGTAPTLDAELQDSADGTSFAAVDAGNLPDGQFAQVDDTLEAGTQEIALDTTGCRRFVRLQAVVAGAAGQGFDFHADIKTSPRPRNPDTAIDTL